MKLRKGIHHLLVELSGWALEHPIARDVGAKHVFDPIGDVAREKRQEFVGCVVLPSVDGDAPFAYVSPEDDALRTVAVEPSEEARGLLHRYAAQSEELRSTLGGYAEVFVGLDATAKVDGQPCGGGYAF